MPGLQTLQLGSQYRTLQSEEVDDSPCDGGELLIAT